MSSAAAAGHAHLVAVDGSAEAEATFAHACDTTPAADEFYVAHGTQGQMIYPGIVDDADGRSAARALRDKYEALCAARQRRCTFLALPTHVGPSELALHICRTASLKRVRTVFIGSRGASQDLSAPDRVYRQWLGLGSVSAAVVQECARPVCVVKRPTAETD